MNQKKYSKNTKRNADCKSIYHLKQFKQLHECDENETDTKEFSYKFFFFINFISNFQMTFDTLEATF